MFDDIVSRDNLTKAYLNLIDQMDKDSRLFRYSGWDSLKLSDLEVDSAKILEEIRLELLSFSPISPAILVRIPKKNKPNKVREIYIYNLKDRIKAQAIYQIIEPYFDKYFSPWLFSYRTSHPSYFAARSVVRHYNKYCQRDSVIVADMADYSSHINLNTLIDKIKEVGFDENTVKLLSLFIKNTSIKDGFVEESKEGLITGTPLIGLFNNLYLDALDKHLGKTVDFYRRVGDDLIIFDQNKERLDLAYSYLLTEIDKLGLKIHVFKTKIIKAKDSFEYLGYSFNAGKIGFSKSFEAGMLRRWKLRFNYYKFNGVAKKKKSLSLAVNKSFNNLLIEFRELSKQKKLVNDFNQIRRVSENFFVILTGYFFKNYTPKNRRLLEKELESANLKSFYKIFSNTIYGRNKKAN
jgi:retron-type reverse transcriptase